MSRGTWQGSGTWQTTGGGGGGLVLAVIAAAVLLGSGAASAIASALVTILIITAAVLVLAVAGAVALLAYRARRNCPGSWAVSAPAVHQLAAEPRPHLEASGRPAIEPPREIHLHIHVADPAEAAAIIRTAIPGQAGDVITEEDR